MNGTTNQHTRSPSASKQLADTGSRAAIRNGLDTNGLDRQGKLRSATTSGNESEAITPKTAESDRKLAMDDSSNPYRNFVLGKTPCASLGPCAHILQNSEQTITVADPRSQRVTWDSPPRNVLVIRKLHDDQACGVFCDTVRRLIDQRGLTVFIEDSVLNNFPQPQDTSSASDTPQIVCNKRSEFNAYFRAGQLHTFHEALNCLCNKIDFVVCIGGDGTLLHVSNLFQTSVPPVLPFNMGTLGFLTPLPVEQLQSRIDALMQGDTSIILHSRLRCDLYTIKGHAAADVSPSDSNSLSASNSSTSLEALANLNLKANGLLAGQHDCLGQRVSPTNSAPLPSIRSAHDTDLPSPSGPLKHAFGMLVLNDVVVSRCPPQIMCQLDLFVENELVTTVASDGLIVATSTGSTAYAMSAGASLCHPNVPAIIVVPICAHSLSFRPLVLPIGVTIRIAISPTARYTFANLAFDGREMRQLRQGDMLTICTSRYPVPCVCADDPLKDWFAGLRACLHWNSRKA